jgi:hypothetical protein
MFKPTLSFRSLLAVTTTFGLIAPVLPANAQDDTSAAAPPARVGEIAAVNGTVNFNGAGSNGQWIAASPNYPLTTGDSVFTQPGGQATLALDASRITLAGNTELQVTSLDNNTLAATASQGETFLAINYLQSGQSFAITTPRGTVTISQNGNYDIVAGDQNDPTVVTVLAGAATVTDPGATVQVQAGQDAVLSGTDQTTAQLGTAEDDSFVTAMLAEQAPPPPAYAPPVVQQMTGVSELGNYGTWNQDPSYGAVWYPQVAAGWAPYHVGHWAYVAPWGYTWVDSEPWGFAPFHYGRWIDNGDRWGWVPAPAYAEGGPVYQPVYAPALVSFFGVGAGVGLSLSVGIGGGGYGGGGVGWVPLGPNEPYYPPYHVRPDYFRQVNNYSVRNIQNINYNIHNTTINNYGNYVNRRAAVYVPADAMSRGEPVRGYAHPVAEADFAKARPIGFETAPGAHGDALPPPAIVHRAVEAPHLDEFAQRRSLPPAVLSHEPAPAIHPGEAYAGPRPGAPRPGVPGAPADVHPAMNVPERPNFATNPGYHPPPPPPMASGHMSAPNQMRPAAPGAAAPGEMAHPGEPQTYHPEGMAHPPAPPAYHPEENHPVGAPPAFHPEQPAYHPAAPAYHPEQPAYHPAAPAYHPEQPAYHPVAPAYHPEQPAYHPAAPAFHPEAPHPEAPRPQAPRPEAPHPAPPPHPDDQKKPG